MPVACANNPEPTPVDTASKEPTSESPTVTKTPSASPSPSAAAGSVEEQLEAATVAFYAAVTKAYATLDPAPIEAVIVPHSRAGGFYLNDIATVRKKGHRFSDVPEYTVDNFEVEPQDADPSHEIVTFKLLADFSEEVDEKGRSVEEFPAGSANGRIEFMKEGDTWLVLSQRFEE
ncbi:hypothetical protein ABN034_13465 [Actinopolymorpha sp. B11F2]|uniref:hypothetical protein n=1 Tax=Actinopolymorpha sp. B11F2 TaxID=3160862 RepID=UPI0032E37022